MPGQGEINTSVQRRNLEPSTCACPPVFRPGSVRSNLVSSWFTCKSIRLDRRRQGFRFRSGICFRRGTLLGSRSGDLLIAVCHQLYFFKSAAIVENCERAARGRRRGRWPCPLAVEDAGRQARQRMNVKTCWRKLIVMPVPLALARAR